MCVALELLGGTLSELGCVTESNVIITSSVELLVNCNDQSNRCLTHTNIPTYIHPIWDTTPLCGPGLITAIMQNFPISLSQCLSVLCFPLFLCEWKADEVQTNSQATRFHALDRLGKSWYTWTLLNLLSQYLIIWRDIAHSQTYTHTHTKVNHPHKGV